eukprot:TRINITY_DN5151_c0_g1_i1.p1 TRINITY_DN5151_c0_g1~~TRINITY_DN5151_c0_g1_i1.p1  ORF type:complete len:397 (-),score=45.54 TRINITY_DN5151_c0_g1_i1:745-1935(-)
MAHNKAFALPSLREIFAADSPWGYTEHFPQSHPAMMPYRHSSQGNRQEEHQHRHPEHDTNIPTTIHTSSSHSLDTLASSVATTSTTTSSSTANVFADTTATTTNSRPTSPTSRSSCDGGSRVLSSPSPSIPTLRPVKASSIYAVLDHCPASSAYVAPVGHDAAGNSDPSLRTMTSSTDLSHNPRQAPDERRDSGSSRLLHQPQRPHHHDNPLHNYQRHSLSQSGSTPWQHQFVPNYSDNYPLSSGQHQHQQQKQQKQHTDEQGSSLALAALAGRSRNSPPPSASATPPMSGPSAYSTYSSPPATLHTSAPAGIINLSPPSTPVRTASSPPLHQYRLRLHSIHHARMLLLRLRFSLLFRRKTTVPDRGLIRHYHSNSNNLCHKRQHHDKRHRLGLSL